MTAENNNWSYNEFLAFLMIYGAEMNAPLSKEELEFIKKRTSIEDIGKIKTKVDSLSDAHALEIMEDYKKKYLSTGESKDKAKHDLEEMLKTPGAHSQLEKVAVHLIEKLIL